jgi:hypothetical protein
MTLFEFLIFLLFCAGLGFVGHLISPQWGALVGVVPAMAMVALMLFFTIKNGGR